MAWRVGGRRGRRGEVREPQHRIDPSTLAIARSTNMAMIGEGKRKEEIPSGASDRARERGGVPFATCAIIQHFLPGEIITPSACLTGPQLESILRGWVNFWGKAKEYSHRFLYRFAKPKS